MGLRSCRDGQLASANHHFPHAGLPTLRGEPRRTSFHECSLAHGCRNFALRGSLADDARNLAKRFRCCGLRDSSASRRIGGVGGRTKRRPQRGFLRAHYFGLRSLHTSTITRTLRSDVDLVCLWINGKGDARDPAFCSSSFGLLAIESLHRPRRQCRQINRGPSQQTTVVAFDSRKNSALDSFRSSERGNSYCSATEHHSDQEVIFNGAHRQCLRFCHDLSWSDSLADESG